jgi:chromosome segregation ATPase
MTDEDREKFDAIRMNLELTGHDLESMREKLEILTTDVTELRVATANLRATAESHEKRMRNQELLHDDLRENVRSIAESTKQLIEAMEGRK